MLQQNNNNNSLCLDMAHRELLQGCGRSSAPLSFGAIGFGAIPLIKGLRAWAVSGGFNARNRRKTAEHQNHQQTDRQRGWKTKENLTFRTPGALVTVATLKGSEGVRQTQTRCLFLKAEGCSYLCTVGNSRPAGSRAAGPRINPNSAEGSAGDTYGSGRGRRASQDDGACEVKPPVVRKWRKSSKVVKSSEKSSAAESRDEPGQGAKRDFTSQIDALKTSDCAITACLKAKHKHAASSTQPGTVNKNTAGIEKVNDDKTHLHRCEPDTSAEASSSASGSSEVYVGQEEPRPCKDSTEEATASIKQKGDLVADVNLNHTAKTKGMHFVSDVPKPKEFSPEELMQVTINRNANISHSCEDIDIANIVIVSRTPSDDTEGSRIDKDSSKSNNEVVIHSEEMEEVEGLDMASTRSVLEDPGHDHEFARVENGSKAKMDKDSFKSENGLPKLVIHSEEMEKDEGLDMTSTKSPLEDPGQGHDLAGMENVSMATMGKDSLNNEKNEPEVVIQSEQMEKDEALNIASTNSPKKDLGQGHDLAGEESGSMTGMNKDENKKNQTEEVKWSEDMEKDEGLDVASTKSPQKDPGQGLELLGMENGPKATMDEDSLNNEKNQPEMVIRSEEIEKNEEGALDVAGAKSPLGNASHDYDLAGVESGSKATVDKDSLKNEKNQSEVVIHCKEMENVEDLEMASASSPVEDPCQGHDPAVMETGFKAKMDKDLHKSEIGQSEVVIHFLQMEKEEALSMASTSSSVKDPGQGHDLAEMETGIKARKEKDSLKSETDQFDVVIYNNRMEKGESFNMASAKGALEDPDQGHDLARMDKDSIKSENIQSEVVIHSYQTEKEEALSMASTDSPVEDVGQGQNLAGMDNGSKAIIVKDSLKIEKNQPEVVIRSKEMEKDGDESLDMTSTRSPVEDPGQGHNPAGVENENSQAEVVIHSLQTEKDGDESLDAVRTKSQEEDSCQGHDPAGVENVSKARMDKDSLKSEKSQSKVVIYTEEMEKDEALDIANARSPREDPCQGHVGPLEECCPPQQTEVNSVCEEQWFTKSPSQGSPKASAVVATACLLNPAFTSTSNSTTAIATAPPALSRQEEVGAGFRSLRPQPESQLLSEQERGQGWSKVATNERPVEVGDEEEDEFGVFMQAGEEQIWTEEFNELQQVPSGMHDGIGHRTSTDANEPMSWTSDWTGVQSFHQSDDSWATFKQEDDSRGAESEIAPAGQWWSSTAVENSDLTLSSLNNVSRVFLEAFPSVDSTCGETDCVPTLKELLQRPAENNRAAKPQSQNLLDGLQDLDRMIDVKYKRAESLSRKLLLQSLHLGAVSSERASGRKQATARFSPNLPSSNQQLAANAKRRLSYDINRNIMT
ncbi:uncharacterized protein si:ch211-14c7.2 [Colossoma macropomum]|uniref:uncharacterized protein si:ch211-14c7.2 n=1 Tax=Colossoma macropomum TaxID=42526 RepID=UPI00186437FB|nr:uncharacterized protein si:ch211-14c7.2 [Colossoma macropomum]